MSLFTDGLPAWWAMVVAVAALLVGFWLGWRSGRSYGYLAAKEDAAADRAVARVRAWRAGREERTAAFLEPSAPAYRPHQLLAARHDSPDVTGPLTDWEQVPPEVAHEAWLAHTEQALDLANDGQGIHLAPADDQFLTDLHARLDNWLDENVYSTEES